MFINMNDADADYLVSQVEAGDDNPQLLNIVKSIKEHRTDNVSEDTAEVIHRAREEHHVDGTCEIDDETQVSWSDKGAYVMAWVYLDDITIECPSCGDDVSTRLDPGMADREICVPCDEGIAKGERCGVCFDQDHKTADCYRKMSKEITFAGVAKVWRPSGSLSDVDLYKYVVAAETGEAARTLVREELCKERDVLPAAACEIQVLPITPGKPTTPLSETDFLCCDCAEEFVVPTRVGDAYHCPSCESAHIVVPDDRGTKSDDNS